jgi:hypothetical protein
MPKRSRAWPQSCACTLRKGLYVNSTIPDWPICCSLLQIYIARPDGGGGYSVPAEPLAWSSPGATLGIKFDLAGNLYIANAPLGLLQVGPLLAPCWVTHW